jgi:hypothetical protein
MDHRTFMPKKELRKKKLSCGLWREDKLRLSEKAEIDKIDSILGPLNCHRCQYLLNIFIKVSHYFWKNHFIFSLIFTTLINHLQ